MSLRVQKCQRTERGDHWTSYRRLHFTTVAFPVVDVKLVTKKLLTGRIVSRQKYCGNVIR